MNNYSDYEREIAEHFRQQKIPDCEVVLDARVPDSNGVNRQIDVLLIFRRGGFEFRVGVEAKYLSRSLDLPEVDALVEKIRSVGIEQCIVFAPKGATTNAKDKLARQTLPKFTLKTENLEQLAESNWGDYFLAAMPKLQDAKDLSTPSAEEIDRVRTAVVNLPHYARFFFFDLENTVWLQIFLENGVLDDSRKQLNAVPFGLVVRYAAKCAEKTPTAFLQFCELLDENTSWAEDELIRAALKLNQSDLSRFTVIASEWAFDQIHDALAVRDLFLSDARINGLSSAFAFLSRATRIEMIERPGIGEVARLELVSPLNEFWFYELLKDLPSGLASIGATQSLDYFEERAEEALRIAHPESPSDLPTFRVHRVDGKQGFVPKDYYHALVFAYRDALRCAAQSGGPEIHKRLSDYIRGNSGLKRRCSLLVVDEEFDNYREIVGELAGIEALWNDLNALPELENLVTEHWSDLTNSERISVLERVLDLPIREADSIYERETTDQLDGRKCNWLLLLTSSPDLLPAEIVERVNVQLEALSSRTGITQVIPRIGIQSGFINDVPIEAVFEPLTAIEVLRACEMPLPDSKELFYKPTHQGRASKLRAEVAKRPSEFLDADDSLWSQIRIPAYHAALFEGLSEASRNPSLEIDLRRACELAATAIRLSDEFPVGGVEESVRNGSGRWTRLEIFRFVERACHSPRIANGVALPALFRTLRFAYQGHPPARFEEREAKPRQNSDWMTDVINDYDGCYAMALCLVAVCSAAALRSTGSSEESVKDELKGVCEESFRMIDSQLISSRHPMLRSPVGFAFTMLFLVDENWATSRSRMVFDKSDPALWEPPFAMHFWETRRYVEVFLCLRDFYEFVLEALIQLGESVPEWAARFSQDLACFWFTETLSKDDTLMLTFFERAPQCVRAAAVGWIRQHLESRTAEQLETALSLALLWWDLAISRQSPFEDEDVEHMRKEHESRYLGWLGLLPPSVTIEKMKSNLLRAVQAEKHLYVPPLVPFLRDRFHSEPDSCATILRAVLENEHAWLGPAYQDELIECIRDLWPLTSDSGKDDLRLGTEKIARAGLFAFARAIPAE